MKYVFDVPKPNRNHSKVAFLIGQMYPTAIRFVQRTSKDQKPGYGEIVYVVPGRKTGLEQTCVRFGPGVRQVPGPRPDTMSADLQQM